MFSRDLPLRGRIIEDVEKGERLTDPVVHSTETSGKIKKPKGSGRTEGDEDAPEIPKNNLAIVMPAIGLVAFIASLDQSIVSTALPTIATELNASPSQYSWVGTSYLLAQTLMSPINGRLTDIVGRKPALYASIMFLMVFSALCGSAKNIAWLIIARAFAGIGGGSIVGLSLIIVSDVVPLEKRGAYQGYLGASWGAAGALGPILGGILTQKANWRWCFYINLPTCGIALLLLMFTLKLSPNQGAHVADLRRTFDYPGLIMIMSAAALTIIGFSTAADDGFSVPRSYGVIIAGVVMLIATVAYFLTTKRNAIIPARMFKNRTTLLILFGSFANSFTFMPSMYLLPQYLQGVRGASTLLSGVLLVPFSVSSAVLAIIGGQVVSRFRIIRPVIWIGYGLGSLGYGMYYAFLSPTASLGTQEGLQVLAAAGFGLAVASPMTLLQAAMPIKDMAASTSAWVLVRSLGATIGLAVLTAVLNSSLRARFEKIEGYGTVFQIPTGSQGYAALKDLPDGPTKTAVLKAFSDSLRLCWIINCSLLAAALVARPSPFLVQ
ncbi:major facilitator superfamily domain-containing protein [Naematelia encephala]|uniref:Major facilitator superfamily domain-containing protein n=1 Tax=Naematelia encephala TaxID=71784 RepID=A0A1Y2BJ15_9TREE|nr:major facilitator superfamily domain-containing protein [Naematelia encephala]